MDSLIDAFFDMRRDVRCMELRMCDIPKLVVALKGFERALHSAEPVAIEEFIDVYHDELARVKFTMKTFRDGRITSLHDKIFTNMLDMPARSVPKGITRMFDHFIRGITYFEKEKQADVMPIYHRLFSCGKGNDAFRKTYLVCDEGITNADKKKKQARIRKCYLERLIYDEMYAHETVEAAQDPQHLFRLNLTREDFKSCFKGRDIRVGIAWDAGMPIKLTVSHLDGRGEPDYVESFTKTIYFTANGNKSFNPMVDCEKMDANRVRFYKQQSFQRESIYQKMSTRP